MKIYLHEYDHKISNKVILIHFLLFWQMTIRRIFSKHVEQSAQYGRIFFAVYSCKKIGSVRSDCWMERLLTEYKCFVEYYTGLLQINCNWFECWCLMMTKTKHCLLVNINCGKILLLVMASCDIIISKVKLKGKHSITLLMPSFFYTVTNIRTYTVNL